MSARAALITFIDEVRAAYPGWRQRDLIANFRRAIPGYSEGVWTAAMPLNSGPSDLPVAMRERLWELIREDAAETGVDLGHVLVCLDLALTPDLIDNHFASWAGDLGLHALRNHRRGSRVPVGLPDRRNHANRSDLLGDIDGEVLARRMESECELDSVFLYYADEPPANPLAAHVSRRFELFLRDYGLLDEGGAIRPDAADPNGLIGRTLTRYVFWEQLKNYLAHLRLGEMLRLAAGQEPDAEALRAEVDWVVEGFVGFLREGYMEEVSRIDAKPGKLS